MANEFERRIAAAAKRKTAAGQNSAQEQQVNLIRTAIADWHSRIGPMIEQAVMMANQQLGGAGLYLTISKEIGHSLESGPSLPMRPILSIFAEAPHDSKPAAATKNTGGAQAATLPHIQIGLQADGRLFVTARHCRIPQRPALPPAQVDKAQIRSIIADYVDAIIPAAV